MRDDCLDTLNLLVKGDISQEPFSKIINLCLRCSRGSSKGRSTIRDASARIHKSASRGVTRAEVGNLFENFETNILSTLSNKIMTTKINNAQGEVDTPLAMFCPNFRRKHPLRECEMNSINLCNICELEHSIGQCTELPRLKEVLRESSE